MPAQEEEKKKLPKVGAFWVNVNEKTGKKSFTGSITINDVPYKVSIIPNNFRTKETHPHWIILSDEIFNTNTEQSFQGNGRSATQEEASLDVDVASAPLNTTPEPTTKEESDIMARLKKSAPADEDGAAPVRGPDDQPF